LTLHQAIDINVPIACGDVAVFPGDVIVGDEDGVIVIPSDSIDEVAKECEEMNLFETYVLEQVNKGKSIIGLYPPTHQKIFDNFKNWKIYKKP
jgi:regulator of RNase E activity RraA